MGIRDPGENSRKQVDRDHGPGRFHGTSLFQATSRVEPMMTAPPPAADASPASRDLPFDCLVISDPHLGSDVCQAKLLEEFLEWAVDQARVLVINGDIFDDLNFKRLTKRHFACLKVIRRNSDRDAFRLVWVRGNHDGPADIISHIVGVEILDEYVFRNDQIQLLILHGDQFDTFITHYRLLTALGCGIFYQRSARRLDRRPSGEVNSYKSRVFGDASPLFLAFWRIVVFYQPFYQRLETT